MSIQLFKEPSGVIQQLGNRIFACSVAGANEARGLNPQIPQQVFLSMVFEFTFFYLALAFDEGFANMNPGRRKQVHTELVNAIMPAIVDFLFEENEDNDKESMTRKFTKEANERLEKYCQFENMVSHTGTCSIEDTALWSFSETIAKLSARGNNHHFIMAVHSHVLDSLVVLDLQRFASAIW